MGLQKNKLRILWRRLNVSSGIKKVNKLRERGRTVGSGNVATIIE